MRKGSKHLKIASILVIHVQKVRRCIYNRYSAITCILHNLYTVLLVLDVNYK